MGIAIIVPIYNTEKYLKDCLNSIINQTVPFAEVILINDGSTDNSYEIAKEYEKKYTNICVYSQENLGQAVARNRGLKLVTQEYVMFLDSDDYIRNDTVEILSNVINKNKLDVLYFDSDVKVESETYSKINRYSRIGKVDEILMTGKEYFVKNFPQTYVVSPCMVLFNVGYLRQNDIIFPEVRAYEDEVFSFIAMIKAQKVKYLPEMLYVRRYRANSTMTSTLTGTKWYTLATCYLQNWKYIIQHLNEYTTLEIESMQVYLLKKYLELRSIYMELDEIQKEEILNKVVEVDEKFSDYCNMLYKLLNDNLSFRMCRWYSLLILELSIQDIRLNNFISDEFEVSILTKYRDLLVERIEKLPLKTSTKVIGVYGTGKHTEKLLKWYNYLLGPIQSKLIFIDSNVKSYQLSYQGYPVVNVRDLKKCIDEIIISSNEYEKEMYCKIQELYGEEYKIYRFYEIEKDDMFVNFDSFKKKMLIF